MFWKEPEVQTAWGEATHVVFLGDYLDPYSWERIRWIDAWDNFMEIVEAKKKKKKKVTLLLGNHDYHYAFSEIVGMKGSRYNWDEAPKTTRFFQDNLGLFQFAWSMTNSKGLVYLFTHAGVVGGWVKIVREVCAVVPHPDTVGDPVPVGEILLVGINYNTKTKVHSCVIEEYNI